MARNVALREEVAFVALHCQQYEVEYCLESLVGKWCDTKDSSLYEVSVNGNSKITIRTTRPSGKIIVRDDLVGVDSSGCIIWGRPGAREYWLSQLDSRSLKWKPQRAAAFVWHRVGECPARPWTTQRIQ